MENKDVKQLDLLAIFHYIVGVFVALSSCMFLIHVFMGLAMLSGKMNGSGGEAAVFGWLFVIMGSVFVLLGWTLGICLVVAGQKLKQRKNRMFCMVVAGVACMFMPFGTILGVFTLIALNKESVQALFESNCVQE